MLFRSFKNALSITMGVYLQTTVQTCRIEVNVTEDRLIAKICLPAILFHQVMSHFSNLSQVL